MSSSTFSTLGISINNNLESRIQVLLGNYNNLSLELSKDALSTFNSAETKQKVKVYFEKKEERNPVMQLDPELELHFVKIYNNLGLSIKSSDNIKISFFETTAERFHNLKPAIDRYTQELEDQLDLVRENIQKVKLIFENYYYTSILDQKIVKKIIKYGEFDPTNLMQIELITICYKNFLVAIETQKRGEVVEVE